MGYSLNAVQAEAVLQALKQNYSVYAPKRFPKQGRYSDTDVIKYAEVEHYEGHRVAGQVRLPGQGGSYPHPAGHLLLHRG